MILLSELTFYMANTPVGLGMSVLASRRVVPTAALPYPPCCRLVTDVRLESGIEGQVAWECGNTTLIRAIPNIGGELWLSCFCWGYSTRDA